MTCRSLLWIAAAAVSVGVVASTPSIAGADPDQGWNVTIDEPATSEVVSKTLRIEGTAANEGLVPVPPDSVTVTVAPQGLPETCGSDVVGTAPVERDRYVIEIPVLCNGPHQIRVVAHAGLGISSGGPRVRDVGVIEAPTVPSAPELEESAEGGLMVTWAPTNDLDAAGSVLRVDDREIPVAPGVAALTLPPANRSSIVSVRALRWGAGGPGSTVSSEYSMGNALVMQNPHTPDNTEPPPSQPTTPDPPAATPTPPPPGPSGTAPPSADGGAIPTRGTGAPSTTLPEGFSEELPFGAPDGAFVPGSEPDRRPSSEGEERAVSRAAPVGGLVTTTEKRSPGLVVPFALGLLLFTIAVHIAWYLRRSRPTGGGQVRAT